MNNGSWSRTRGESQWIPDDAETQATLQKYGANGVEYRNSFPDFSPFAAIELSLKKKEYTYSNPDQFKILNEGLSDYFGDLADEIAGKNCVDPLECPAYREKLMDTFKCDESEQEDIQAALDAQETPFGFTWHHTERPGVMQLVPTLIHTSARHRGGQSIWGGGAANR